MSALENDFFTKPKNKIKDEDVVLDGVRYTNSAYLENLPKKWQKDENGNEVCYQPDGVILGKKDKEGNITYYFPDGKTRETIDKDGNKKVYQRDGKTLSWESKANGEEIYYDANGVNPKFKYKDGKFTDVKSGKSFNNAEAFLEYLDTKQSLSIDRKKHDIKQHYEKSPSSSDSRFDKKVDEKYTENKNKKSKVNSAFISNQTERF